MYKRILISGLVVVSVAVAAGLVGRGSAAVSTTGKLPSNFGAGKKITFIVPALDREIYLNFRKGAQQAQRDFPKAKISIVAGQTITSADRIIALTQDAITKHADVIVMNSGGNDDQITPSLKQARVAGIKVITYDQRMPKFLDKSGFIGVDSASLGVRGGQWLVKHLPQGGTVGILGCLFGNPVTDARLHGYLKGIAGSKLKVVTKLDAKCDQTLGRSVTDDMLSAHPNLDAILCISDSMVLGAIQAAKAQSKDPLLVTMDGYIAVSKYILSGQIVDADVPVFSKVMAYTAVVDALKVAEGQSIPKVTNVTGPWQVVDKTNAKAYLASLK